jgi:hypothetical protein
MDLLGLWGLHGVGRSGIRIPKERRIDRSLSQSKETAWSIPETAYTSVGLRKWCWGREGVCEG